MPKALRERTKNLIFCFNFAHREKYGKQTFTLDYERNVYRQDDLVKLIDHAVPYFALTEQEFIDYCSNHDVGEARETGYSRISKARKDKKGDYGELLLFLILDILFEVPKFVTKVRLRSSIKDQIKGYDCAHVTIENGEPCLWLGEAKFHQNFSSAVGDAFKSLEEHLETSYIKDELKILGGNIEWNREHPDKDKLNSVFLGRSLDKINFKIPVLLTYDSPCVQKHLEICEEFKKDLIKEVEKHYSTIEKKVLKNSKKNFEFIFIVFPLHTVSEIKTKLESIEELAR